MLVSFHVQVRAGGPAGKVFGKKILADQREVWRFFFQNLPDLSCGKAA